MNSNSQQHSGSARSWMLALVLVIGFGAFVIYAKVDVDRRMMRSGGVWAIEPSTLPPWFPPQFSNQLGELHRVPSRVSLHSVRWKEGVIGELSAIPWIESVQRVERTARGIGFEGQLVRPSVGIRIDDGWLLVDGIGNVLATQPGDFLFPEWKMPEYMPGAAGSTQPVAIDCAVGDPGPRLPPRDFPHRRWQWPADVASAHLHRNFASLGKIALVGGRSGGFFSTETELPEACTRIQKPARHRRRDPGNPPLSRGGGYGGEVRLNGVGGVHRWRLISSSARSSGRNWIQLRFETLPGDPDLRGRSGVDS